MTEDRRASSFAIPLFAGAIVLGLLAGGVFGCALRADCPNCEGEREAKVDVDGWWVRRHPLPPEPKACFHLCVECTRCSGSGQVSLLSAWMEKPPEALLH